MAAEEVEYEVLVDAPAEMVWEVLTEPDHLGWLGGAKADVDLRPGGTIIFHWAERGHFLALVTTVEHPHRLAYRWALEPDRAPAPGNATEVEFTLTAEGGGTRLRVVERGFESLTGTAAERAQARASTLESWSTGFTALAARAVRLAGERGRGAAGTR